MKPDEIRKLTTRGVERHKELTELTAYPPFYFNDSDVQNMRQFIFMLDKVLNDSAEIATFAKTPYTDDQQKTLDELQRLMSAGDKAMPKVLYDATRAARKNKFKYKNPQAAAEAVATEYGADPTRIMVMY